jgi:predicted Zn-dependent protease
MRLALAVAVAGLATVALLPAQGRSQLPFAFNKVDLKLLEECEALDRQFDKRALIYRDAGLDKYLTDLATPLLPSAPLEHVQWKFRILRDPAVNAFGLPNGSIYVDSGLLARAENDDQVSARLAQEIAHVVSRDCYRLNRSLRGKFVVAEIAEIGALPAFGVVGETTAILLAGNRDRDAVMAAIVGYPRAYEREADQTAVRQLQRTGRDPAQLVRLTLIVDDKLEPEPVSFWKDPPNPKERIANLKVLAGLDHDPAGGSDGGYLDRMRAAILQNIQLDLDTRRFRSAVAGAERLVAAHPDDAVALFWLGESYRCLGPHQEKLTAAESTKEGMRSSYWQATGQTEQDEANRLMGTPEGGAALRAHQARSEELFRKAADADPSLPDPYFGLGSLYQQQGKKEQAIQAYRKYIELCKQPADIERARRRIEDLMKEAGAK